MHGLLLMVGEEKGEQLMGGVDVEVGAIVVFLFLIRCFSGSSSD